jgi:hypothetical protein
MDTFRYIEEVPATTTHTGQRARKTRRRVEYQKIKDFDNVEEFTTWWKKEGSKTMQKGKRHTNDMAEVVDYYRFVFS